MLTRRQAVRGTGMLKKECAVWSQMAEKGGGQVWCLSFGGWSVFSVLGYGCGRKPKRDTIAVPAVPRLTLSTIQSNHTIRRRGKSQPSSGPKTATSEQTCLRRVTRRDRVFLPSLSLKCRDVKRADANHSLCAPLFCAKRKLCRDAIAALSCADLMRSQPPPSMDQNRARIRVRSRMERDFEARASYLYRIERHDRQRPRAADSIVI